MKTQGIEARSGETGTGSTEGESPSGKAGAPKLDWTAPLMLDDGKGTGVPGEDVEGPADNEGAYRAKVSGNWRWYDSEGVPFDSALPRIINRPKPDAEPVEQLPADEGLADAKYLIRKGGAYYRPNAEGYTLDKAEAGRYTLAEAILHSYPNGASGPRDGIDFILDDAQPTPDTVTVPRMTEAEAWEWADDVAGVKRLDCNSTRTGSGAIWFALSKLNLIKPDPTPLDRFTASHPNWRDLPVEEAVRLALEQRGEG